MVPAEGSIARVASGASADRIRDAGLRIEWARRFMPVAGTLASELATDGAVRGIRIGISMVLEPKTANLALFLRNAGAIVSVYAHPAETDDAVAEALRGEGIPVDARSDASVAEAHELALAFLDRSPQILLDDGSHLIRLAHRERPELLEHMIGAAEETTSGLRPLREMQEAGALRLPVIAVNDARTKTLFDNGYGTGQSCVFTIIDLLDPLRATWRVGDDGPRSGDDRSRSSREDGSLRSGEEGIVSSGADGSLCSGEDGSLYGKTVVVVGFGPVGEGVARNAAAFGANVIVVEHDPVRALEAMFAGYRSKPLIEAVRSADLVISATGVADTISLAVLESCAVADAGANADTNANAGTANADSANADNANADAGTNASARAHPGAPVVVAVAGGVPQEVAVDAAVAAGAIRQTIGRKVETFTFPGGRRVVILDDGGCINVTAGEGNPIEIMDLSFAVQLAAVGTLVGGASPDRSQTMRDNVREKVESLDPGVHAISSDLDGRIARIALAQLAEVHLAEVHLADAHRADAHLTDTHLTDGGDVSGAKS